MANTLSTNRYVPPGTYIQQIITPTPAATNTDLLVSCYVGKGSRLAMGRNLGIRRSYVYDESLVFSPTAPYRAMLNYPADGNKDMAILRKSNGTEVRSDQWAFYKSLGTTYDTVEINVEIFDPTTTYYIDYQSTSRTVKDPLPVDEIREINTMGDNFDTAQYREYTHYYIETSVSGPNASTGTPHLTGTIISPTYTGSAVAAVVTGCIAWDCSAAGSVYTGDYLRNYSIHPISTSGANHVKFRVTNNYVEPGLAALPKYEVYNDNEFFVDVNSLATGSISLGMGLTLRWTVGSAASAANFTMSSADNVGWHFNAVGEANMELDPLISNTNQFATISTISHTVTGARVSSASLPGMSLESSSDYTGDNNARYNLKCTSVSGTNPAGIRTASFLWASVGIEDYFSNTITFTTVSGGQYATAAVNAGITLQADFGAATGNFYTFNPSSPASGNSDQFYFTANAPRDYYRGKDDRDITVTVTNKNAFLGTGVTGNGYTTNNIIGTLVGTYNANTPEGGYASFSTAMDINSSSGVNVGKVLFNDNMTVYFKNMVWDANATTGLPTAANPTSRFSDSSTTSDVWTFNVVNDDVVVWDLDAKRTENVESTSVFTDVLGTITGTPNTKYIILDNIPTSGSDITIYDSNTPTAATVSGWTFISGTSNIYFDTDPVAAGYTFPLVVEYTFRSAEPDPGELYYLTASYIRPEEHFNTPILLQSRQAARDLLAPAAVDNDLYIMSEIAWDNNVPEFYIIQVKDADEDGIYTKLDFKTAVIAAEGPERIADIIILNKWDATSDLLKHLDKMADPFVRRFRLGWFGMPVDTPIGDNETQDTLVYTGRTTLQVYGDSPAHGTRILVGSTKAKTTIQLENGVSAEVTLDGSFIAGALAAINRAFPNYNNTILRKTIGGFTYIETYGDVETPDNKKLGESSIIYITDRGTSVYRIEEDFTVDNYAQDFNLIMHMTIKQYVTRYVYTRMDEQLVSLTVPSPGSAIAIVRGFLLSILDTLIGNNVIGPFVDNNGSPRPIDPDTDIQVFINSNDSTRIDFLYSYYLPTIIKRLYGLYTVNKPLPL